MIALRENHYKIAQEETQGIVSLKPIMYSFLQYVQERARLRDKLIISQMVITFSHIVLPGRSLIITYTLCEPVFMILILSIIRGLCFREEL